MPLQTLAPDALLLQTNLTGAVTDVDEDPDSPDASFLLAPALQSAAAKTFYLNDTLQGAGYSMLETAPATANFHGTTSGSGWNTGNVSAPRWEWLDYNTQVSRNALDTTEPAAALITASNAGNYFRSPNAYTGSFAAGNWTLNMDLRGTAESDVAIRWHVWASTDPQGATNQRQLTSAPVVGSTITATLSTTTLNNSAATWAALAQLVNNEFLFFTPYLNMISVGGGTARYVNLVKASTSRVLTPAFSPVEPDTRARVSFPIPTYGLQAGAGLQEFRALVRKKGTGTSPTATLALYENGAAVSTLVNAQSVTNTTGQVLSGTFDGTGRDMTQIEADVLGTGAVGGSVEVGAFEWNVNTTVQQVDAGYLGDSTSLFGATIQQVAVDTDVRVSFPTPPEELVVGAGLQEFRVGVRKSSATGTPTVRLELWNNGSFLSTVLAATNVTSTTGQVVSGTWNASALPSLMGQNVELRIFGAGVSGGSTVEVGGVEWNALGFTAQVVLGYLGDATTEVIGATIRGDTTTVSAGYLGDATQLFGATIQGPVLQAGMLHGPLFAGAYPAGQYYPRSIASTHELYGATISSGASGGYERVKPNVILDMAGLTGAVADIDDDPDDSDNMFLEVG